MKLNPTPNEYRINSQSNTVQVILNNDQVALIDRQDLARVYNFHWRAVKYHRSYYARSTYRKNNTHHSVSMHRLIAKTKATEICHHRNRNTLDNRSPNLLNMSKNDHQLLHQNNSLLIKFEIAPRSRSKK